MGQDSYAAAWRDQLTGTSKEADPLVMVARSMIAARRALSPALPREFVHNAPLDMLLSLFVADGRLSLSELERVTTVTAGVAHRWLDALAQRGLIDRGVDIVLTEDGRRAVIDALGSVIASQQAIHGTPVS